MNRTLGRLRPWPEPWPAWLELAALATAGGLQSISLVRSGAWALPWLCIALLAWRVRRATPRWAAALGAAYATAWLASAVWWLFISMHRYGGLPAWMAAAAVALLALLLSGYLALALAAVARARRGKPLFDAGLFALAWLAAELARALLFTGFPWAASGYTQIDGPLAWLAPWIGVYGIGALSALIAAGAVELAHCRTPRPLLALGSLWLALALGWAAGPTAFTRAAGELQVTLLQPNVAQDEKFASQHLPATLQWVADALLAATGDLVVAPETAVPMLPGQLSELAPGYWAGLQAHFAAPGRPAAMIGVPLGDPVEGYTNSVSGLDASATAYRYDKVHLVPFGEFIPPALRWFTEMMNIPLGDFRRGDPAAPAFAVRQQRVLPNICFEDLFGEELAAHFGTPATAPTLLVNLSNIGWFGRSAAPQQHLNISRMRTLELQRPMLRATNTGATAIIDHQARVQASLPGFTRGVLTGKVSGRAGRTPYTVWVAWMGLWPLLWVAWLGLLWAAVIGRERGVVGELVRGTAPGKSQGGAR